MERKILVEVSENELEALKKGLTIKNISTEELINEIILRCNDKQVIHNFNAMLDMVETVLIKGTIQLNDKNTFKFECRGARKK